MTRIILAIETSCDETAAAIIVDGKVKSNVVASQALLHSQFGGVVPEVTARKHIPAMIPTIDLALKQAKLKLDEVDYIAVTQGPGLKIALMVGIDTAKALAFTTNKPLIPINHIEGHIYANFIKDQGSTIKDQFPALILTVSGGHTMLVHMAGHGKLKIVGETLDDAAGEAFDKTARLLGLGYPGGAKLSQLAKQGNPKAFNFPRPMINSNDLNFSFSGLKTAVLYKIKDYQLSSINSQLKADLAASIQQAIVESLIAKLKKAIEKYRPKTIMLGGGVAANDLLRKEFIKVAKKNQLKYSIPKLEYCTDNAAMIGLATYYRIKNKKAVLTAQFSADPNLKLK